MPVLRVLYLSGASKGTVSGFSSSEDCKLKLTGACSVAGDIRVGDVEIDASAASNVELIGSAKNAVIEGSATSHVELGGLSVHDVDIKLTAASTGTVNMD